MESKVKNLQEAKKKLKTYRKSVLLSEEKVNLKLLKKLKKLSYLDEEKLLKLINIAENSIE